MSNPWDTAKGEVEGILKTALGELFDRAVKDDGPFFAELAEDMARETYKMHIAQNEADKKIHQANLDFLAGTVDARATRIGLQYANVFTAIGDRVLEIGIKVATGFLKSFLTLP